MTPVTERILKRLYASYTAQDLAVREDSLVEFASEQWNPNQKPSLGSIELTLELRGDPILNIQHEEAQTFNVWLQYEVELGRRTRAAIKTHARTMSVDIKRLIDLVKADD